MKILVVLTALAAVAIAGPTFRAGDADLDVTKVGKRSPTPHHHIPQPVHIAPVHHAYVQPVIPHHLGLKKPLFVKKPYGHHIFRSEDEQLETHSAESKESKNKCMKEMEAKCDDDTIAKSSELEDSIKIEDIDGNVSDREVAQSLQMAKEAVDNLQKKLQLAEKNSRMTQWAHGQSDSDARMHENVETAKLALEHMQHNFGNLESMNVHAREFKNAEVHDVKLELKTDEERLAQWKDAIENIQKNVELVKNIEDSFQHNENSEKSAVLENGSSSKHEMSDDHKHDAIHKEHSEKSAALENGSSHKHEIINDHKNDVTALKKEKIFGDTIGKSSWQAREHEKSSNSEMETSASTLSESKTTLHSANEQKSFRSEASQSEKSSDIVSASNANLLAEHDNKKGFKDEGRSVKITEDKHQPMEHISQPSLKSSENLDGKPTHPEHEKMAPFVDTTTLMKSAEHNQAEQHSKIGKHGSMGPSSHKEHDMSSHIDHHKSSNSGLQHTSNGHSMHKEHDMSSHLEQHKSPSSAFQHSSIGQSMHKEHDTSSHLDQHKSPSSAFQHSSNGQSMHKEHDMSSHFDHHKSSPAVNGKDAHETSSQLDHQAKENKFLDKHESSSPAMHSKDAHETMLKSSDQMPGQSQQSAVAVKPVEHIAFAQQQLDKHHSTSLGAHGKSAEDGSLFAPIQMNSAFKQALAPKSWKESHGSSRGAYGSGLSLGGSYGAGYGGSGAVGVFPNAHVGGCAIPLLLSCSPSVVAGSLAKSHSYAAPSYAASAYRGSENSNSHTKRDITKISRPFKTKKPTNKDLKQKTILIADKL